MKDLGKLFSFGKYRNATVGCNIYSFMQKILDFFKGDPWLNILFLVLAIGGIILAIVFYLKSLKEKKPVFSKKTFRLVSSNISTINNLEIKFKDVSVKNLSLTKFAFWNSGKDPIKSTDIASSDPLLIRAKEGIIIYDFEISHQKLVNNIKTVQIDDNTLSIIFEFLNLNDGVVLTIYHSGQRSSDLALSGTIVGTDGIFNGVKRNVFANKADFITNPINHMISQKNLLLRIIGWGLAFPIGIFIIIPLSFIILPLDFINERIVNKSPKEFQLHD